MSDNECMEMCGGEDLLETDYLREMMGLPDTLDHSDDSLTAGQFTLPTFTLDQSAGLQVSQGFQVLGMNPSGLTGSSRDLNQPPLQQGEVQLPVSSPHTASQGFVSIQQCVGNPGHISSSYQLVDGNIIVQNVTSSGGRTPSNLSTVVLQSSGFNPVVSGSYKPREILPHPLAQTAGVKQEVCGVEQGSGCHGDSGGGSSDEKSGQSNLTSPKKRGKKGRSSAAAFTDQDPRMDLCGGVKCEPQIDVATSAADPGLTPSLEDILTEKKMALLRSPEVMEFLRQQQQRVINDKQHSQSHGMES